MENTSGALSPQMVFELAPSPPSPLEVAASSEVPPKNDSDGESVHVAAVPVQESAVDDASSTSDDTHDNKTIIVDDYGFIHAFDDPDSPEALRIASESTQPINLKRYRERESIWIGIIADWENQLARNPKKIKKLAREGIPNSLRARVWQLFAGTEIIRQAGIYQVQR